MKVHVRPFKSTFLEGGPAHFHVGRPLSPCSMIWIGVLYAVTLESKSPWSSHLLSAPLAPVYLDVEHTLSVGAAMVMVPKQRRLVPLARTNFVGQHPVRMKQSWLNCLLAQQTGRNPDGIVCAPKKLRGFNWAGHAVNNRSRYMF